MDIRGMQLRDLDAVLGLVAELNQHDGDSSDPASTAVALRLLLERPELGRMFVVEQDGELIGYAVGTLGFALEAGGPLLLVDEIYVRPAQRGQGVGSVLLRHLVAFALQAGCRDVDLEVAWSNRRAAGWYRRLGFRRHRRYYCSAAAAELAQRLEAAR